MFKKITFLMAVLIVFLVNGYIWSFNLVKTSYAQENITKVQYKETLDFALQNYDNKLILSKKETKNLLDRHFNTSYIYFEQDCINWNQKIEGITYPFLSIISLRKDITEKSYGFVLAHEICHYVNFDNNEASTSYSAIVSLLSSNDKTLQNIAYFGIIYVSNFDDEYDCIPNIYMYLTTNHYL
jgi:hypothetical protein